MWKTKCYSECIPSRLFGGRRGSLCEAVVDTKRRTEKRIDRKDCDSRVSQSHREDEMGANETEEMWRTGSCGIFGEGFLLRKREILL